jgi:hypothetical protein
VFDDTFRGERSKRSDRRLPPSQGEKERGEGEEERGEEEKQRGEGEEAASQLLSESCHANGLLILSPYIIDS